MSYQSYSPSSLNTPRCIGILIFITALSTVCCAALNPLFIYIFKMSGPLDFFGLSVYGLSNYYLWQPLTCLFIQNDSAGLNFFFLLSLTFNMYMIWLFGGHLVESYGATSFLRLYFTSGIIGSLLAVYTAYFLYGNTVLVIAGVAPSLLATFVAWAILHRDTPMLIFFLIPIKAKWLLAAVCLLATLIPLSELDFIKFIYYFSGISIGYLYSTLVWQQQTPFEFLEKTDDFFIVLGRKIKARYQRWFSKEKRENKIVDIKTGQAILDDEAFIDEMLAKISRYGEKSLTWQERDRMRKISENKMKK